METGTVLSADRLADRVAIEDVLAMHCRGVDRADAETLKSCYWPDATVAYGGFNGVAHDFCEVLPDGIRRYTLTQHSITNVLCEFAQDDAVVETYVTAYHYVSDTDAEQGNGREMTYLGRYVDRFEARGGVWKIRHRQVVMDWNQNTDATAIESGPPFDGLARGARRPQDPVFAALDELRGR